jgi:hypothetical protein
MVFVHYNSAFPKHETSRREWAERLRSCVAKLAIDIVPGAVRRNAVEYARSFRPVTVVQSAYLITGKLFTARRE